MFSATVIVCAYPARKLHNFHLQSPTPASQYRTTSVPAHPAGTPTQPSPRATIIAGNVVQGCRPALTGNGKGHKRRLRVQGGTHGQREGAEMSPKGAGRHSRATGRDINVAQGCRAALTGNGMGHKCRPRVPDGTHGLREGAKTSPKGAGRHSRATGRDINVAQGYRAALTGNRKGLKRLPRVQGGTHRQQKGAETSPKGVARHSRATGRGENVAQRCRAALAGYEKGRKRRPRVSPGTHGQREGT